MKRRVFALLMSVVLCFSLASAAYASTSLDTSGGSGKLEYENPNGARPSGDDPKPTPGGNTGSSSSGSTGGSSGGTSTNGPGVSISGNAGIEYGGVKVNGVESTLDKAKPGDKVSFQVNVHGNNVQDGEPVATDANGNPVALTNEGNGVYSFIMPNSAVTIIMKARPEAPANPFVDVASGEYYFDAVMWAVQNGITAGTSATTFSPNETCTRAQTVTFLWRAAGSPVVTAENPFTDVAAGAYYYNAVLWAVQNGITNGTSATTFSPDDTVTRGQTVTFQYRAAKAQAVAGNNPFVDVAAGEFYAEAVQWAVNNGITNGTSATTFGPDEGCTRGQIVTFLYRAR